MKDNTEQKGTRVAEKLFERLTAEKLKHAAGQLAVHALCALCAYAMAGTGITLAVYPLGMAFVIALDKKYVLSSFAGFLCAGLFAGIPEFSVCISAAGVAAAIKLAASRSGRAPFRITLLSGAGCALTLLISRLSVLILTKTVSFQGVMLTVCEAVLTVLLACFFFTALPSVKKRSFSQASAAQIMCVYITLFCIFAGLCRLDIGHVSAGRAAALFLGLMLCRRADLSRAGCCVFAACAIIFAEPSFYFAAAGMALGCTAAACLSRSGKLVYCAAFLVCSGACALIAPNLIYALVYVCELSGACAVYMLLPDSVLEKLIAAEPGVPVSAGVACATARLKAISLSFSEIAALMDKYCSAAPKYAAVEQVVDEVSRCVCRTCDMMSICWVQRYSDTFTELCRLTERLSAHGSVGVPDMGTSLSACCINPVSLCAALNERSQKVKMYICKDKNVTLYRQALEAQFRSVAQMLSRTNSRLSSLRPAPERMNERIAKTASMLGMSVCQAESMWVGQRLTLSLWLYRPAAQDARSELAARLLRITEKPMCESQVTITERGVFMEYCEQPLLRLDFAAFQGARAKECGDSYSTFTDSVGRTHLVLADGMGTGRSAALDSAVCCALTRRLLENGFDPADCVQLVNSVLSIRDFEERAVTMDTLMFDGYSGKTTLLKAGAAPTFVVQNGKVTALGHGTLPVGIMDEPRTKSFKISLSEGDIVLMLSDGALNEGTKALAQLSSCSAANTPDELLDSILDATNGFCGAQDDITLIVGRVSLCEYAVPKHK